MEKSCRSIHQTTKENEELSEYVTITHLFHPAYNQKVEVVRRESASSLIVRLPNGEHVAILVEDTDYSMLHGGTAPEANSHLLHIDGLRQIVKIIDWLKHDGRLAPDKA